MIPEKLNALVRYRMEEAQEALADAEAALKRRSLRNATNRAYYAMFYGILALLALTSQSSSKHTGVIALFDREFVKTGAFGKNLSEWLHDTFARRQEVDYKEFVVISEQEATERFEHAREFVGSLREYLINKAGVQLA
ncbi:MAG: HEPN domain-containing protein [Candidatus Sumerlaeota bacterium]|nr:HEPN domain-containing protein [Candidatus Sumerlaeota bacterium]